MGLWNGEDVIVFVEAKNNLELKVNCRNVKGALAHRVNYWKKLVSYDPLEVDDLYAKDYANLCVAAHQDRTVKLAFGGFSFPLSSIRHFKGLEHEAFRMSVNLDSNYVSIPMLKEQALVPNGH